MRRSLQPVAWTGARASVINIQGNSMILSEVFTILLCVLPFLCVSGSSGRDCVHKPCEVRARTESGWVCGRVRRAEDGSQYASFRGVPYGKPPVGERRFQELEPVEPWANDRAAAEDSPACPQKELIYGRLTSYKTGMSEDCIYLNIHVPFEHLPHMNASTRTGLPVLVMIHGGGFNTGSGLTDLHGPEYLMTKQVIVVTFNYRINVFGFLSLNSKEIPGNQGLRDQVTLLRWVQRNARAFGGDPSNVTIMGQSAGASCAHMLTLSKVTKGLFKRAILLSGTAIPNYFTTSPKYAQDIAKTFLSYLNINSTDPVKIHRQLIQLPLVDIMYANTRVQHIYGLTSFVPVVENDYPGITRVLDDSPLVLIAQGRGKDYPSLIGYTDKESEFFKWICINLDIIRRLTENPKLLLPPRLTYKLSEDQLLNVIQLVNQKYFNGTLSLENYLKYLDYSYFKYPALKLAEWRTKQGGSTYLYRYSYRSERSLIKEALWSIYEGAAHVEDMTFIFRVNSMLGSYVSMPPRNNDDRMKIWMTTMITNFMQCSNPTCSRNASEWTAFSRENYQYQSIADPGEYRMSKPTAEETDMVQFFDGIDSDSRDITNQLINEGRTI